MKHSWSRLDISACMQAIEYWPGDSNTHDHDEGGEGFGDRLCHPSSATADSWQNFCDENSSRHGGVSAATVAGVWPKLRRRKIAAGPDLAIPFDNEVFPCGEPRAWHRTLRRSKSRTAGSRSAGVVSSAFSLNFAVPRSQCHSVPAPVPHQHPQSCLANPRCSGRSPCSPGR